MTAGLEGEFSDNHRRESQLLSPQRVVVVDRQAAIACAVTPGGGGGGGVSQPFQTVVWAQAPEGIILCDGQEGS